MRKQSVIGPRKVMRKRANHRLLLHFRVYILLCHWSYYTFTLVLTTTAGRINTTMASRSKEWKMAPRISIANFASDWRRLEYFREVNELPEKEVICQLPFLLEDQLFVPYINSCQRLKLVSVAEAEKLLLSLAGVRTNSYSDFMAQGIYCVFYSR